MTKRQTKKQIYHQQNLLANWLHYRQLIPRLNNEETNKQTNKQTQYQQKLLAYWLHY